VYSATVTTAGDANTYLDTSVHTRLGVNCLMRTSTTATFTMTITITATSPYGGVKTSTLTLNFFDCRVPTGVVPGLSN